MTRLILFYLLQLLSGVSIPLHTVHYGRMKVPIVLQYQTEADSCRMAVAPGWTLRIGEDLLGMMAGDTLSGDGIHFHHGSMGMLKSIEDDAGHQIALLPEGIFWPRGAVHYHILDGVVKGFQVLDADSATVCNVTFEAESELKAVRINGRDSTEVREYVMEYDTSALLHSIARSGGGSVEYSFVPEANRLLKRSVCRKDAEGKVTGVSEYVYNCDSLGQYITEVVTDGQATLRKIVRGFWEGRIQKKEEFSDDNRLLRSTLYQYTKDHLESVTVLNYPKDSLASPRTRVYSYKYAEGQPYPVEVETSDSEGSSECLAYSYPFCPSPGYGPIADSLLARGMAGAVLSVSRWKDGVYLDSTSIVYADFLAPEAPFGKVFRPYAVVYSEGENSPDTCLKYKSYDLAGLRTSRTMTLHKKKAKRLPPEIFRRTGLNPLADIMREQCSYAVCAAWPDIVPNQEGESFLFGGTGAYLGKVEADECGVVADRGIGETPLSACFSDPGMTPLQMDENTTLELVSTAAAKTNLAKAGALDDDNQGFFKGMGFLWRESHFGRRLDFATNDLYDVYPNILYVTEAGPLGNIAHDNYNYGNYLWGATAHEVGVPQWIALIGSHLHAFFSPYSFGSFDSPDDIFSIRAGYHWDGR